MWIFNKKEAFPCFLKLDWREAELEPLDGVAVDGDESISAGDDDDDDISVGGNDEDISVVDDDEDISDTGDDEDISVIDDSKDISATGGDKDISITGDEETMVDATSVGVSADVEKPVNKSHQRIRLAC